MPVTLLLRTEKGTPLTNTEMDVNLSNIKVAVEALEVAVAALPEFADVTSSIASAVSLSSLRATLDPVYVDVAGDTMSGLLTLSGPPTVDLHAATKKYADDQVALRAPLASPALTGTPTAPTASIGTNTTQLATTAFVQQSLVATGGVGSLAMATLGSVNPTVTYGVTTVAGSSLLVVNSTLLGGPATVASGFTGTWKFLGLTGVDPNDHVGLWQRIA